ncbi:transcriptional regulator [Devosia yakushimensis]|uniref:Transcriptional regulator n=1 Tax=Devosia yakushimensis TaxID=470028 RepID=A0ABQ5UBS5_9HYPH|nr:helix-turn-helix domain-containing protein [Devosia yakushimensis]GLQ09544.1 transcriptional regulator [Devosia yakushimensis]
MTRDHRSGCPINLTLEVLGDKWSLLILRDMIFGGKRHFRELLRSQEGIASNILSQRLAMLVEEGLLTKADDASHKQKAIYSLTGPAIELVPIMAQLGSWGRRHQPVSAELSIRAQLLEEGGPTMWDQFMDELRTEHLHTPSRWPAPTVRQTLQAGYEEVVARQQAGQNPPPER